MPEKFQNKYRIPSTRWQDWNYRDAAAYFITICTRNREHYFGEIRDGKMYLSTIGKIVESEWLKTPEIRADMNLELDEFVVMPNHFHAILIIGENEFNGRDAMRGVSNMHRGDAMHGVSTKFGPQSKNLGSVIRGFKSSVTTQVKKLYDDSEINSGDKFFDGDRRPFQWQSRFHDHVIRDEESFDRIRQYIINNPLNWKS